MTKEKWRIFEEVIKKIYDISLSDYEVKIDHDIKLKGKSGASHQIDVFVQISMPLITIKEIIDCKHWNSNVKKSEVTSLDSIRNEVNANKATIISRKGFQRGAIQYARFNGINLYKIITPDELGVHTAAFVTKAMVNEVVGVHIELEAKEKKQLGEIFHKDHDKKRYNETTIYNYKEEPVANIFDLIEDAFNQLQKVPDAGLKVKTNFLRCHMLIDGNKKNINYVEIHVQKRFIDEEKSESIKDTKLLIHDVVNNKMFLTEKPINFSILEKVDSI